MEINIPLPSKRKGSIYGKPVELDEPNVEQIEKLQAVAKLPQDEQMKAMRELAVDLGVPKDIVGKLRFKDFTALMEDLTGVKKK